MLTGLIVAGAPVTPRAAAEVMNVPRATVTDLGTSVHDLVVAGGSLWATLPDENRVSELDAAALDEQRRVLVGSSPRGIDVLDDGQLAIALYGATGYVELDPATGALTTVTLPLLGASQTWDIANIGNDKVLVSSNAGSGGLSYIVRVDRSADRSSTRVADQRIIRATPVFAHAGSTVLVGEGFMPNSLYRLDGADPSLPLVAEDNHGDVSDTQRLAISPDGSRAYLGSGQVVRTSDIVPIGAIGPGYPVLDSDGSTAYALAPDRATAFETATFSPTAQYDLSACGFTTAISAALMPTDTTIFIAAGTRICRIDLDEPPGPPTTPLVVDDPPPSQLIPRATVTDLGTSVHDLVVDGGSLWATLPDQNRVAELDAGDLAEQRRLLVGSSPRGIDVLDDGQLAIALYGATGYVEVDPATGALTTVTLPLLGAPQTWDVANIGNDKVLVSAAPGSSGSAFIVRVDRSADRSSTRVADERIFRAGPVFADAASTVLVSESGFSPESLFRLDGTDPSLPIAAGSPFSDLRGTHRLAISPDGSRGYLGSGQVVRTSDIVPIGAIGQGYPVVDSGGTTAYALAPDRATAFEPDTFSPIAEYDLSACGFTTAISAALMTPDSTIVIAAGSRICQITLTDAVEVVADRGELHPLEPTRILDTRSGVGGIPKVVNNASVQIAGRGGVPSTGASAVVMNVTVTEPTASSFLTVYPAGMPVPTASNLNYLPGDTVANLVTVKLGQDGKVALFNLTGSTHVIFDIVGWYSEAGGLPGARFHPMAPERFVDTREHAWPLGPGEVVDVQIAGVAPIPPGGVSAVVINVTATEPTWAGFLTVWPGGPGNPVPLASNVNFSPGDTRPNLVVVPVAADGWISVYNHAGSTHVVIDVVGWYDDGANPWAAALRPLEPARLLDTRIGVGAPAAKLGAGTMTLQVTGRGGLPAQGVSAVILNVTVVNPTAGSFLTVWPSGLPQPTASNLNYAPGQVVPNLVVVKVSPGGAVDLGNYFGEVDVVADVVGWFGPG